MEQWRHITLELVVGSDPIVGAVRDECETRTPFCGWVEFASALERLLRPSAAGAVDQQAAETHR